MDENNVAENLYLPREEYEPVVSRPVDLGGLDAEIILSVFTIKGNREIKTCYGDICKIVDALRDYSRMLTMVCDTWDLHGFHRIKYEFYAEKLRKIADKFQAEIGYDYDATMEKCRKKKGQPQSEDVGGEAMAMGFLKAQQTAEAKARKAAGKENPGTPSPTEDSLKDDAWAEDV